MTQDKMRDELYEFMVEGEIATDEELGIAIHFGGNNLETMESVLFYKTGYRSLAQLMEDFED